MRLSPLPPTLPLHSRAVLQVSTGLCTTDIRVLPSRQGPLLRGFCAIVLKPALPGLVHVKPYPGCGLQIPAGAQHV